MRSIALTGLVAIGLVACGGEVATSGAGGDVKVEDKVEEKVEEAKEADEGDEAKEGEEATDDEEANEGEEAADGDEAKEGDEAASTAPAAKKGGGALSKPKKGLERPSGDSNKRTLSRPK
jgi:hypothetical protein